MADQQEASFEGFMDTTVAKKGGVSSDEHYSTSFGVSRALAMPELQSKWDLPVPDIFYCDNSDLIFRFDMSDIVENYMLVFNMTRGEECDIDIWDNNYLIPYVEYDLAPAGDGSLVRQAVVGLKPDVTLLSSSPLYTISEDGTSGLLSFCLKATLYTNDMSNIINWRDVKFQQETVLSSSVRKLQDNPWEAPVNQDHRHLAIDCSAGYDVVFENWWSGNGTEITPDTTTSYYNDTNSTGGFGGILVAPDAVISMDGSETSQNASDAFFLEAYECDENNAPTVIPVYEQGAVFRACIKPDERAQSLGLYMRSILSMYFHRPDLPATIQYAVEGGQVDFYGMSQVGCERGSSICWIETVIRAEFFSTPGVVRIAGIASLQFGSGSTRRDLSSSPEDDDAVDTEFDRQLQNQASEDRGRFTMSFPVTTFQETLEREGHGGHGAMSQLQAILMVVLSFVMVLTWIMLWWIRSARRVQTAKADGTYSPENGAKKNSSTTGKAASTDDEEDVDLVEASCADEHCAVAALA